MRQQEPPWTWAAPVDLPAVPVILVLVLRVQRWLEAGPAVNLLFPGPLLPAFRVALQDVDLVDEGPARLWRRQDRRERGPQPRLRGHRESPRMEQHCLPKQDWRELVRRNDGKRTSGHGGLTGREGCQGGDVQAPQLLWAPRCPDL